MEDSHNKPKSCACQNCEVIDNRRLSVGHLIVGKKKEDICSGAVKKESFTNPCC